MRSGSSKKRRDMGRDRRLRKAARASYERVLNKNTFLTLTGHAERKTSVKTRKRRTTDRRSKKVRRGYRRISHGPIEGGCHQGLPHRNEMTALDFSLLIGERKLRGRCGGRPLQMWRCRKMGLWWTWSHREECQQRQHRTNQMSCWTRQIELDRPTVRIIEPLAANATWIVTCVLVSIRLDRHGHSEREKRSRDANFFFFTSIYQSTSLHLRAIYCHSTLQFGLSKFTCPCCFLPAARARD